MALRYWPKPWLKLIRQWRVELGVLVSRCTVDFDQISFGGQSGHNDKGVRRLMIPKNFLSDLAHGRQVIPIRYICRHLYNIYKVHANIV